MSQRPEWVRRWEDLHVAVQVAIVFPVAVLVLWAVHVTLLNQPAARGLGYAAFWAIPVTGAVVGATRSERARRLAAAAREDAARPRGGRPGGSARHPDGPS